MTNRFCDLCGWETPSLGISTRIKKKRVQIGWICQCCGKIHAKHFPTLFLLRDDALRIKRGERKLSEFQPGYQKSRQKSEALSVFEQLDREWGDCSNPHQS